MSDPRDFEGEMARLRDRMNRLFSDFSKEAERPELLNEAEWTPALDVLEDKDNITIRADMPGMEPDEIDLSISGDVLHISGERKREIDRNDENYHAIERGYGKFHRRVDLPAPVEVDNIKASYKNGVLTVKLPKIKGKDTGAIKVELS